MTTTLATDQAHLMHPLHHPSAYAGTRVWVKGEGARITDSTGREYIDGLSGLWNVNVGHGRRELGRRGRSSRWRRWRSTRPTPAAPTSRRSSWPSG